MELKLPDWITMAVTIICIGVAIAVLVGAGSSDEHSGVDPEIVGEYTCENVASDGKTDTSFYALRIEDNGEFSIYDTTGNPGISGQILSYSKDSAYSVMKFELNTEDVDPPRCWSMTGVKQSHFWYRYEKGQLKIGYDNTWLTFHRN